MSSNPTPEERTKFETYFRKYNGWTFASDEGGDYTEIAIELAFEAWTEQSRRMALLEQQASLHNDQCAQFEAKIVELERENARLNGACESYRIDRDRLALQASPPPAVYADPADTLSAMRAELNLKDRRIAELEHEVTGLQQYHDWSAPQVIDHGRDTLRIEKLQAEIDSIGKAFREAGYVGDDLAAGVANLRALCGNTFAKDVFVERIVCYDRYGNDGQDLTVVLRDIENEAKRLWHPDGPSVETSKDQMAADIGPLTVAALVASETDDDVCPSCGAEKITATICDKCGQSFIETGEGQ